MPKRSNNTPTLLDASGRERAAIVMQLRKVLAWLDMNKEPMAAIHVNQAIEVLEPTTMFSFSDIDRLN